MSKSLRITHAYLFAFTIGFTTSAALAQSVNDAPVSQHERTVESAATTPMSAPPAEELHGGVAWNTKYGAAYAEARSAGKMLLVNFVDQGASQRQLEEALARHATWRDGLRKFVVVRQPVNGEIFSNGKSVRLLSHPAFSEMHGRPGIAVIDFANKGASYYGCVVSAFPFMSGKYYSWRTDYFPAILELPPGTATQRTMVFAVRVHPENPQSTYGTLDERLARAASQHSNRQANMGVQGHHDWGSRFQRIQSELGGGAPTEIVAESWPGQTMIDSCFDCVRSWRFSSGHWGAVRGRHARYGFDIRRGRNGIWYGTGIFSGR